MLLTDKLLDPNYLMDNVITIADKSANTVALVPNPAQLRLDEVLGKFSRIIVLKARQMGISTRILARFFCEALTTPNLVVAIISHEDYATQRLFDKIKMFLDGLPRQLRPQMSHNSAHEIVFNKLHSVLYVGTAGSRAFGRGDTVHRCLASETGFWGTNSRERVLNGLEEAIGNNQLVLESTPNGEGNAFHQIWTEARSGQSIYHPIFLPWYIHPEYALPEGSEYALERDRGAIILTPEEIEIASKFHLSRDQIRWRRRKLSDKKKLFFQEYPEDEVTCFLASGMSVFDMKVLGAMLLRCREPALVEDSDMLRIWQLPRPGESYIIGADVAEGMTQGWSAAIIINAKTLEHVATLRGKWETNVYGAKLAELGNRYNQAMIAPERNSVGNSVINTLVNQINYSNVYREMNSRGQYSEKYGWVTSSASKPIMVAMARELIESYAFVTFDEKLIADFRRFRYLPGFDMGVIDEEDNGNADIAMATMIALSVRQQAGPGIVNRAKSIAYTN